ncbi:GAF domain-containing protein [Rapidithrix thailandica]|uniref:GAF domain-containing protein n=1 Tax=Rapidithrix thailandica TaxID=413964 RepID=A0AAW9S8D7_9BACT
MARKISLIGVIFFIVTTSYAVTQLYLLPQEMLTVVGVTDHKLVEEAANAMNHVNWVLSIDLCIVLVLIVALSFDNLKSRDGNIVYVEKSSFVKEKSSQNDEEGAENSNLNLLVLKNEIESEGDIKEKLENSFQLLCKQLHVGVGALYQAQVKGDFRCLELKSSYAFCLPDGDALEYKFGEGLVGQAAKSNREFIIDEVPENYMQVTSGLGSKQPSFLTILPIVYENDVLGVIELGSFRKYNAKELEYIREANALLAIHIPQLQYA